MIHVYGYTLSQVQEAKWLLEDKNIKERVYFFATEKLLRQMDQEVFAQAKNVASLPGLAGPVCIMPDAHSGYGAPIGTVFAMDKLKGYISPGAIGYDINCGMRLITTNLSYEEIRPKIKELVDKLFEAVPPGAGAKGFFKVNKKELKNICQEGSPYIVNKKGLGVKEDIKNTEDMGYIKGADFSTVSDTALMRGQNQLATLGSGNHYLEIQKVEKIFDLEIARKYQIFEKNQIVIMLHCGSRGLGHQVCTDYLKLFEKNIPQKISFPDIQLASLPIGHTFSKQYLSAMACAANFAFANRQLITYQIRKVFEKVFNMTYEKLGLQLIYDVAHNIGKFEQHNQKTVFIHRKGATRSYPYQPVIIGGSMETGSYLLIGTETSLSQSYGSTAHGSGRTMSRTKARKIIQGNKLQKKLLEKGIYIKSRSLSGLVEEAGQAYKDINEIISSIMVSKLSKPVAHLSPIGNIKG